MTQDPTSDGIWQRAEIESPCVKLCVVHPETRTCIGCHRSLKEIGDWSRMTPEARRVIMDALPARAEAAAPVRRGGRAARLARKG